jgi:uncharacterized membrane protein
MEFANYQQSSGNAPAGTCHSQKHAPVNVGQTERAISTVAGSLVLLCGLSRLSLTSLVAIVAGGALLQRGLTGHCRIYEALEMSTDETTRASISNRE